MLKGINVTLFNKTQVGVDGFGQAIYSETPETVEDVIVAPTLSDDLAMAENLFGKKATYTLGIPKGDTHIWEDRKVAFFGKTWRTFGFVIEGIEENVPTKWHKKVMVERYE